VQSLRNLDLREGVPPKLLTRADEFIE